MLKILDYNLPWHTEFFRLNTHWCPQYLCHDKSPGVFTRKCCPHHPGICWISPAEVALLAKMDSILNRWGTSAVCFSVVVETKIPSSPQKVWRDTCDLSQWVQRRPRIVIIDLEYHFCEERLGELGLFSLEKKKHQEDLKLPSST